MNVLCVTSSMDPTTGGPCQVIRNTIPALEALGVYSEVVCLNEAGSSYMNDSFNVHALGSGTTSWCYNSKLIPWLLENLHRFDVIIIHGLWLYPGYAVRKAIRAYKRRCKDIKDSVKIIPKTLVMPHGMLDPYFQKARGRKLKALRNWFYWKLIEAKLINEADGLLFTCESEKELARLPFRPYNPKQAINIGCGIAGPPAYHSKMRNAFLQRCMEVGNAPYLLFLSRIHEKKGVEILITAYKNLLRTQLAVNKIVVSCHAIKGGFSKKRLINLPKLVIAGPGLDSEYGQKIKRLAWENEALKNYIIFPGMLTGDAKWGAFYGCDVFLLPTHQENFGVAIIEAMACGKPVAITDKVNIWKEVLESGGGVIFNDSIEGTESFLKSWLQVSDIQKAELGRKALLAYKSFFTIELAAKRLESSLSCIL